MPQSIVPETCTMTIEITISQRITYYTKELTGLAADLLGLAAVCKEFRRLSSSAVEPLELKSAVNCCQQVTLTRPFSLIHL